MTALSSLAPVDLVSVAAAFAPLRRHHHGQLRCLLSALHAGVALLDHLVLLLEGVSLEPVFATMLKSRANRTGDPARHGRAGQWGRALRTYIDVSTHSNEGV